MKITFIRLACRQAWGGIFFINDWSGRGHLSVGGVTTGHVVLG